ncbi:lamin tail domain-containing protein [Paenibacillus sp. LHD-117]|uniref:S-layer homology domain-containing protein n=1 Tax=Paenibacillus sp. LHD-117 TaxID=3071412 RepID=UPI0027E1CFFD|nr:S-layer homology domain-containing protein [Paenibacillus sp. LHD-117]MDQ6420720.1 lamin tail domain-containing protein [Paenibacillus sp. LHD-117]
MSRLTGDTNRLNVNHWESVEAVKATIRKQWKKWLSAATAAALLLGAVPYAGPANVSAASELPALMITELVPDTTNVAGADGYEFIEIYNNTDQPVDFSDYSLIYHYFENSVEKTVPWPMTAPGSATVIPAYGTIVLWVMNASNTAEPVANFNNTFGVQLTEGVSLFRVNGGGGMHNSLPRDLIIQYGGGNVVSVASYQNDDQTKPNKGILYAYPKDGSATMRLVDGTGTVNATPGSVTADQVPDIGQEPQLPPVVTHAPVTTASFEADLAISATIAQPDGNTVTASVYYRNGSQGNFTKLDMAGTDDVFATSIPKSELTSPLLQYYIEATDGMATATTQTYNVNVETSDFNYSLVPSVLITELVPDSENVSGVSSDAFEFIEVYNNTDGELNFSNYGLYYRYPDKGPAFDVSWPAAEKGSILIPQGGSIVLWITNSANQTVENAASFNANYGTTLTEGVNLFRTELNDGMSNSAARDLVIKDSLGNDVAVASYQNDEQTQKNKGIFYAYPLDGGLNMRMLASPGTLAATPGAVATEQAPSVPVHLPDGSENEAPVIADIAYDFIASGLEISANVTDPDQPEAPQAKIYYRTKSQSVYATTVMNKVGGVYKGLIPSSALVEDTLYFYIEAIDGIGKATSEETTVAVELDDFDPQSAPELLVTEIVPDSANVGSGDGYEFVEVYNNTDGPLNLKDYRINYRYTDSGPSADVIWPTAKEDVIVPAGESVVFWVINAHNSASTAADFNANYGNAGLTEGVNLFRMYSDGMANGGKRGIVIATNSGIEISSAYYDNDEETKANMGIFYKYPLDGTPNMIKYSAGLAPATPGAVASEQVPVVPVAITVDEADPTIADLTAVQTIDQSRNFDIVGDAQDDRVAKTVVLYYKDNRDGDYTKRYLKRSYNDSLYRQTVFSPQLIGREYIEYYFEVSDGTNTVTSETKRVTITGGPELSDLRLNVKENEVLSGNKILRATGNGAAWNELSFAIDGTELTNGTYSALESGAYFAFETQAVNYYFKNAVVKDGEIIHTFLDPIDSWSTLSIPISADDLAQGANVISIYAGSKSGPFDDRPEENKDDFEVRNVRLVLADGTELYDPKYANPLTSLKMGDSAGKHEFVDFTFTLAADKLASKAYAWDTKGVADGDHVLTVSHSTYGTLTRGVKVDNAAPTIAPTVEEGETYRGVFTIDAAIADAIAGLEASTATLDDAAITLPYATSSAALAPGAHKLVVTATDKVGNAATATVNFNVPDENPLAPQLISPTHNAGKVGGTATLTVKAKDLLDDLMRVMFFRGFNYDASAAAGFKAFSGAADTEPPKQEVPGGEQALNADGYKAIRKAGDGQYLVNDSTEQFPYHRFEITLDSSVKDTDRVDVQWKGKSLEGRKVSLYAWSPVAGKWAMLDTIIAGSGDFELGAEVAAGDYRNLNENGEMNNPADTILLMVQDEVPVSNDSYDFSFVWMSDTQYYSETYFTYYRDNVHWIKNNLDEQKIKYVIHTGDIVDESDKLYQWEEADRNMKVLDDAKIPYGVLAGNHDVDHQKGSYDDYWKWFGENRFVDQPTFGGSYKNNMGHYDLISAGGNDFIIVYMGWGLADEEIDWMNEVVKAHPNRKAILAFHEYLLVSGNRAPIADKVYEKVVLPNKNVFATLSGHYHDAELKTDEIDDNGDGKADRKVYQMLADYQGAEDGGLGYIRLMQFDMANDKLHIKTFSPTLNDYNYYDPAAYPGKDEFSLDLELDAETKRVATDYFGVRVYTDQQIGETQETASGANASVSWEGLSDASYEWYAVAEDEHEGNSRSDIWRFYTGDAPVEPTPGPGTDPGTGTPPVSGGGTAVENGVISVKPGTGSTFKVTEEAIQEAIKGSKGDNVDIVLKADSADEEQLRLELPAEAVDALLKSGKELRIITPRVTIEYPQGTLPSQSAEGDGIIRLTVNIGQGETSADDAVSDAERGNDSLHGTDIVYALELEYVGPNGEVTPIHEFDGAVHVKRTLTDEELKGLDPDYAGVYYLNDDEEPVYMGGTFEGNVVTFETTHFSSYAVMEYRKGFADTQNHWAKEFVGKLAARHAITGIDGMRFAPERNVTRADFAVIAVKALGFLGLEAGASEFEDVAAGKYYAAYVDKAHELGLVTGYQGRFRPEETITREEAAVILMRLYAHLNDGEGANGAQAAFADIAEASEWAREAIEDAAALGLVNGKGAERFDPHADVKRAEIAKMIWLAIQ